jgi:hypothetical protein
VPYVSADDLQAYSGVHEDAALQQNCVDAAENIVNAYLGYSPALHSYIHCFDGNGASELQLKARPITALIGVEINGAAIPPGEFQIYPDNEFLYYREIFPSGRRNIKVDYDAGWGVTVDDDEANRDYIPGIIRMTVLRIAALLQTESDGNIGVTSKSFADSGARTFVNTVNFDKYLVQISSYKLLVI